MRRGDPVDAEWYEKHNVYAHNAGYLSKAIELALKDLRAGHTAKAIEQLERSLETAERLKKEAREVGVRK
jgi:hypothetical protein